MNKIIVFFGIFFTAYYFILTAVMGSVVFSKYLLYFGVLLISFSFLYKKYGHDKCFKRLIRIVKPFIISCLILFLITEAFIAGYSFEKNTDDTDYMVILGAGLRGETMTMTLRNRMEDSYNYLENNINCEYVVVSGGMGPGESISEAEAMERYLLSKGIDKKRIIKEEKSTSTYENLLFSKALIEEHSRKNIDEVDVKLSTSNFHSLRTLLLAKDIGYKNITSYGCCIHPIFIPTYYIREFFALVKTVIVDIVIK